MADDRQTSAELAREAAIRSLVVNLVQIALMIGISVAITKRDWLTRQMMRVRNWRTPHPLEYGEALHELRRDIARFEGRQP